MSLVNFSTSHRVLEEDHQVWSVTLHWDGGRLMMSQSTRRLRLSQFNRQLQTLYNVMFITLAHWREESCWAKCNIASADSSLHTDQIPVSELYWYIVSFKPLVFGNCMEFCYLLLETPSICEDTPFRAFFAIRACFLTSLQKVTQRSFITVSWSHQPTNGRVVSFVWSLERWYGGYLYVK